MWGGCGQPWPRCSRPSHCACDPLEASSRCWRAASVCLCVAACVGRNRETRSSFLTRVTACLPQTFIRALAPVWQRVYRHLNSCRGAVRVRGECGCACAGWRNHSQRWRPPVIRPPAAVCRLVPAVSCVCRRRRASLCAAVLGRCWRQCRPCGCVGRHGACADVAVA